MWILVLFFALQIGAEPKTPELREPKKPMGIVLDNLISEKNYREAKNILHNALKTKELDKDIVNLRLAHIALLEKNSSEFRRYLKDSGQELLSSSDLVEKIYKQLLAKDSAWFLELLSERAFFAQKAESPCPFFELPARKRRAELLASFLQNKALNKNSKAHIFHELYIDKPEIISEERLLTFNNFIEFKNNISINNKLKRIKNLLVFGQIAEALKTYQSTLDKKLKISASDRCELDYQAAKISRLKRNYRDALAQFDAVAKSCTGDAKRNARYMQGQLLSMLSDDTRMADFDSFVADYPEHGFSDDIIYFKAKIYLDKKDKIAALSALDELIKRYPNGDMIGKAYFLKAFTLAQTDTKAALSTLSLMKDKFPPLALEHSQARYWMTRLSLMPNLNKFSIPTVAEREKAELALKEIILGNPTVYSWLAQSLLRDLKGQKLGRVSVLKAKTALLPHPDFKKIFELKNHGFLLEALALLEQKPVKKDNRAYLLTMAQAYVDLDKKPEAYQRICRCDKEVAEILLSENPNLYDEIALAEPFKAEVMKSAQEAKVAPSIIKAIIRQESGFIADAVSWAQAQGLMQIIRASALEQAKLLGLSLADADLLNPALNVRLGSSLFARYSQRLGHVLSGLAAYNAGPLNVNRWLKDAQGMPIDTFIENIPFPETRNYVKNVLGFAFSYAEKNQEDWSKDISFLLGP